ncbi:MAG: phospholipid/cholesterol/gamma-HCH transport system substrate-binding protein [Solirubrobacteraceae bacterium]|nr:phospholipid/cholesterol/gamma-HCH transport system substrate-binding protein [Solirubrobacteraceae bacterium]
MQTTTPSLRKVLTMVLFALSCFGLLLFFWVSFGGPVPLKPKGYQFKVAFPEAAQLGLEADVRVAGVNVGKVRAKDLDPRHRNRTVATIEVDPSYAPIARDTRAILRQKTLLGETYVELTPGHVRTAGAVADGGTLPDGRVKGTVQLDEIFQALDPRTRRSFQGWQQELSRAVNGHSQDLNDALGTLPAFADDGTDLLTVLDGQKQQTQQLIRNTGVVFGALTADERKLHDLIVTAGQTFDATSRRQAALAETFRIFPTFLDESKLTFARVERFSKATDPLVQDLRPALRDAVPTLRDVHALAPDLRKTFTDLAPLIDASKTGLPATTQTLEGVKPMLAELQPFLQQLNPVLQFLEYHQLDTADFISNGAATLADTVPTATPNEVGHYLRQFGPVGPETVGMYPNRPAASRGNAYLNPGALSGQKRAQGMIFPNFDCANAGGEHQTATPDSSDAPSCFVQDPPAWPPGNTSRYPHIDPANYSSK